MRELKFRAWTTKRKCWHYFDLITLSNGIIDREGDGMLNYEHWCQYTGLKDKKGKEIYEGDILKVISWDTANFHDDNNKKIFYGAVSFKYGGYGCFENNFRFDNPVDNLYYDAKHLEIAGNIHENPELINESKRQ